MTSSPVGDLASGQLPVAGGARRLTVTLSAEDHAELRALASRQRVSLSQAMRLAIRVVLAEPGSGAPSGDEAAAGEELALHNLVATEQVLRLLERFLPGGPAVVAEVLPLAVGAAQIRIAGSHTVSR